MSEKSNAKADPNGRTHIDVAVLSFMVIVHALAIYGLTMFSWANLLACVILYFVTGCLGITFGYHRLLTHRSFNVPKWIERIAATCGVLAIQGSPSKWVAHHRLHHAGSDTPKDPHNARVGFWYSHWGWLFKHHPFFDGEKTIQRFARDINADPYYRWLDSNPRMLFVQALLGAVLFAIGGWSMVLWGIFVRLVAVYHTTWMVNSAAHIWGYVNYEVDDLAKNNWYVALLTWGEGWHNNHHAHPDVAPAGHKWWEIDVTYMIIRTLKVLGLAKDIKTMDNRKPRVVPAPAAASAPDAEVIPMPQVASFESASL